MLVNCRAYLVRAPSAGNTVGTSPVDELRAVQYYSTNPLPKSRKKKKWWVDLTAR